MNEMDADFQRFHFVKEYFCEGSIWKGLRVFYVRYSKKSRFQHDQNKLIINLIAEIYET